MKTLFFRTGLLVLLTLCTVMAQGSPLKLKLTGLDKELEENARLYLKTLPPIEQRQLSGFQHRIKEKINHSLEALGYYHTVTTLQLAKKEKNTLLISVDPGAPVIIRKLQLTFSGDAQADPSFSDFRKNLPLQEGDRLNQGKYESIKSTLTNLALARGYFDATLTRHKVEVHPEKNSADITITMETGRRYQFGEPVYSQMNASTRKLLEYLVNFQPGQPYDSVKLGKLTHDISATGYFQNIDVHPIREKVDGQAVPILIGVKPRLKHELQVGAGYSTDEGPRVFLNWDKPWVNDYGHSLSSEAMISGKRTEISSSYKIPAGNPLQDYYSLQLGYQRKYIQDTDSQLLSAAVHRWTKRSLRIKNGWDQDVFFRIESENFRQGIQKDQNLLLIPGISFSRRRIRGGGDPYWGDLQLAKVELSSQSWGSDANFIKAWARTKWLRTYREKHRVITRFEQGAIWLLDDITDIPPSLRFFTGGDQSVRGYAYESLSPRDNDNKLTGARYMTTASLEYAYRFAPKWRIATFVDSGTATNNYKDQWHTGVGFGIRWTSPLGQLKLDLAFAVSEDNTPWRLHFTMGPEL